MRISNVQSFLIAVPFEYGAPKRRQSGGWWDTMDALLVRVDTDDGITGWGEAFGFGVSPVTQAALTHVIAPLCIGRDPRDLPETMAELRRATRNYGRSGPVRYALSGVDVALWDIAGQIAGKSLAALWGGAKRTRIPTYASFLPYHDVDLVERTTGEALAKGYTQIKLHETTVEAVAACRRAAGDGIDLMLDTNCAWNLDEATTIAGELESYGLAWLEEPVYPPDDYDALAALSKRTTIPIAIGENVASASEAERAAKLGAMRIFQPDAIKIGGLSELQEAIARAAPHVDRIAPHSPFFGPALVATLHVIATLEAPTICERFYCDLENYIIGDAAMVVDGHMQLPDGPGLGIKVNEELVERYLKR